MTVNDDGKPYQCKHAFNCPYQLEAFKKVLQKMAEKPEEYIEEKGKRTTNTAEDSMEMHWHIATRGLTSTA